MLMKTKSSLTIIVPVYNEKRCLAQFHREMDKFLSAAPLPSEVIFVNDGSTDTSQHLIEKICFEDQRYHFIQWDTNRGLSTALKAGIDHCDGPLIGYIDADIQTSPMDFLKLLEYIPDYDLVTGVRTKRKDSLLKIVCSRVANQLRRMLNNDAFIDTGCPLKIGKASYLKQIPWFEGMHRFLPSLVRMAGGRVQEVPIRHFKRFAGRAKYGFLNRITVALVDMLAFRWMQSHYIRYQIVRQK
jgi:glycosyltransferase involved in cell wall biosynthesis